MEFIRFFTDLFHLFTDPNELIGLFETVFSGWWAYAILFVIVFSETGLLVGFILPGDSLLFTLGIVAGAGEINLGFLLVVLLVAAILGDSFGYALGRRTGPAIFNKQDSIIFKKEYVHKTQQFFEKHGGKTIIFARFLPVVRSFAPFMAGVGNMNYSQFLFYNILGAFGWVLSMTLGGYFLGNIPWVRENFDKVVVAIVCVSLLPGIIEWLKFKFKK